MLKHEKIFEDIPLEIDTVYKTKFQTGDNFLVKEIIYKSEKVLLIKGIYENNPDLGICPLNPDRIIYDKKFINEIDVCSCCGEKI